MTINYLGADTYEVYVDRQHFQLTQEQIIDLYDAVVMVEPTNTKPIEEDEKDDWIYRYQGWTHL